MDIERLLGSVINGALGGRRKRSRKTMRYLTGGRGSFLNASTLLAVAGVAWGLYETTMRQSTVATGGSPPAGPPVAGGGSAPGATVPPLPLGAVAPGPPPLPSGLPSASSEPEASPPPVPATVQRVIRLTVSAARADGTLTEAERGAIVEHARAVGAGAVVEDEMARPTPLARIVEGVDDPSVREELYTLAFAIVRADETVSGAERIYLAQLAHALGLDADAAARLEEAARGRLEGDEAAST